jgi:hypothetical protein
MSELKQAKEITGFESAVAAAKNSKFGANVAVSAKLLLEVADHVEDLESQLEAVVQLNEMFATSGMETERKLLAMENAASWHSKNQLSQLDQFAMAALPAAHDHVKELKVWQIKELVGIKSSVDFVSGESVRQAVAVTAYLMAEAMQAESQKRQGGAA